MSSRSMPLVLTMLCIVASVIEVSSDHVPRGIPCTPPLPIPVTGFFSRYLLDLNSTGTPNASPMTSPHYSIFYFHVIILHYHNILMSEYFFQSFKSWRIPWPIRQGFLRFMVIANFLVHKYLLLTTCQ